MPQRDMIDTCYFRGLLIYHRLLKARDSSDYACGSSISLAMNLSIIAVAFVLGVKQTAQRY